MTPGHPHDCTVHVCDHKLMFVVRNDGMPAMYKPDDVTDDQAAQLLEMMAERLRAGTATIGS